MLRQQNTWSKIEAGGEKPLCSGFSTALYNHKIYVFGGVSDSVSLNDIYTFDTKQIFWNKVDVKGDIPTPRYGHSCIVYEHFMIIFGGYNGKCLCDVRSFNLENHEWKLWSEVPSLKRFGHSASIIDDRMIVFGGTIGFTYLNDTHEYHLKLQRWTRLKTSGDIPSIRCSHSSFMHKGHFYVFGGYSGMGYQNDLWQLNLVTLEWKKIITHGSIPFPRSGHSVHIFEDQLYLFGGRSMKYDSDLYRYNFSTEEWTVIQTSGEKPTFRRGHGCVVDDCYMFIFGGSYYSTILNDLYCFCFGDDPKKMNLLNMKHFQDLIFKFY